MNIEELHRALLAEGCNEDLFCILPLGQKNSEGFFLEQSGELWRVYYSERSSDHQAKLETNSESEACEYFFKTITAREQRHSVGIFQDENAALALHQAMKREGINPIWEEWSPIEGRNTPIIRIFVHGKEILKVRDLYKELPIRDVDY